MTHNTWAMFLALKSEATSDVPNDQSFRVHVINHFRSVVTISGHRLATRMPLRVSQQELGLSDCSHAKKLNKPSDK